MVFMTEHGQDFRVYHMNICLFVLEILKKIHVYTDFFVIGDCKFINILSVVEVRKVELKMYGN